MSKTPIVITQPLTPAEFAAKADDLKLHHGIVLNAATNGTSSGTVSKLGVVASYSYDGAELKTEITDWPEFASAHHVQALFTSWLQS